MAIASPIGRRQTVAALLTLTFVTGLVDAVPRTQPGPGPQPAHRPSSAADFESISSSMSTPYEGSQSNC